MSWFDWRIYVTLGIIVIAAVSAIILFYYLRKCKIKSVNEECCDNDIIAPEIEDVSSTIFEDYGLPSQQDNCMDLTNNTDHYFVQSDREQIISPENGDYKNFKLPMDHHQISNMDSKQHIYCGSENEENSSNQDYIRLVRPGQHTHGQKFRPLQVLHDNGLHLKFSLLKPVAIKQSNSVTSGSQDKLKLQNKLRYPSASSTGQKNRSINIPALMTLKNVENIQSPKKSRKPNGKYSSVPSSTSSATKISNSPIHHSSSIIGIGKNVSSFKRRQKRLRNLNARSQITNCLIIATDATPYNIGGYCINGFEKKIEFYSLPSTFLPWVLHDNSIAGDSNEFEMKNLLFALLLWEHLMKNHKYIQIYTDNWCINQKKMNEYGRRVRNFIKHLENCGAIIHTNPTRMHVHQHKHSQKFKEVIIPADHLSRRRVREFKEEMKQSKWNHFRLCMAEVDIIKKIRKWTQTSCHDCSFKIHRTASLKPIHF